MPTQELDENIPTLTQIIQPGDASMENHFDASYFDDDHKDLDININAEFQENILNTDAYSAQKTEQTHLDSTFDICIDDEIPEDITDSNKIDEELENNAEVNIRDKESKDVTATANNSKIKEFELKDTIDLLISNAVKEALPSIEKQLTEELSKQIYQTLFSELSKDS